jgi:hypothetical protein
MTSVVHPHSEPPDHEELVAYLDGELAPADCRVVEERLAADPEYRQQLRDLDQAWEALDALPTTTADDAFARTTIELACVAAEEDLSHRKALAAVENRGRKRWWIAGGVTAAVMGFIIVRALAVHRHNAQLADLPLIQQANVLSQVDSIDFLRQLAQAVPANELVKEDTAFERDLADFAKANSESFQERRAWVDSLSPEQKADLADRARAFEEQRQTPEEENRQRKLANDIRREPELQKTLIGFGEWLARHNPGQREQLSETLRGLSTSDKVAEIRRSVQQDDERAARHLSADDKTTLRRAILNLAEVKTAEMLRGGPSNGPRKRAAGVDDSQLRPALAKLVEALRNKEFRDAMMDRLVGSLSPEAQDHWNKLGRGGEQRVQFAQWFREALQPAGPEELEGFFSKELSPEDRQRLLDMPRAEMKSELERLYLRSESGLDDRLLRFLWREFGEGGRGPRNGPGPPEMPRPGEGPGGFQPGGPPPNGPRPPGEPRFDRDRRLGPDGPRGRLPNDRPEGGRPDGRPPLPNDRPPPDGSPGQPPPPRPGEDGQPI